MITIKKAGLFTSIQDLGRYGYQKYGVVVSGAMDPISHRVANILVGNKESDPTIEITLVGPSVQFHQDSLIAICGGDLSPTVNGQPVPMWRPLKLKKGSILQFGSCRRGCRAYIAVAGSFIIPKIMGSTSTYVRGKLGGLEGKALKVNDQIPIGNRSSLSNKIAQQLVDFPNWTSLYHPPKVNPIRVVKGRQYHLFTTESQRSFVNTTFKITTEADRMGYRLNGSTLSLRKKEEMLSEAVLFGTIQVTSDGNPLILMADRQTTGGYPKLAQVISVDFPRLAQLKPGDEIQFEEVTLERAQQLLTEREQYLKILKKAIELKYR